MSTRYKVAWVTPDGNHNYIFAHTLAHALQRALECWVDEMEDVEIFDYFCGDQPLKFGDILNGFYDSAIVALR